LLLLLDRSSSRLDRLDIARLVAGVVWVDEGVGSSAVSTWGNTGSLLGVGVAWSILGSICVVSEVSVCWVIWVDEWVDISWSLCWLDIVVVLLLWLLLRLLVVVLVGLLRLLLLDWSGFTVVGVMGGRVLAIGTVGNMVTLKDTESIDSSAVLDGDGLATLINVTILANSLSASSSLLSEHYSILLSISRSKSSITSIESLLL